MNELTAEAFNRRTGMTTICLRFPALIDVGRSPWVPFDVSQRAPRLPLGDYLDFADAVEVLVMALGRTDLKHEVLFITAETSGIAQATPAYIRRFQPPLEWRSDPPADTTPLIDCTRLKRILGFTPRVTWQSARPAESEPSARRDTKPTDT